MESTPPTSTVRPVTHETVLERDPPSYPSARPAPAPQHPLEALPGVAWLAIYRLMLVSRELDRLEVQQLTPQGRVKLQFSATGHELAQTLLARSLTHAHDAATQYYRSRPFLLGCGLTIEEALAATLARSGSPSEGRDVGVIFNLPRRSGPTVLPASGNVGAQYPVAAGWAQAIQYHQNVLQEPDWHGAISAALGGDGSVAANGFWSALNIATTLNLPMLFFIEDNGYSISVPASYQTPGGNIAANLARYGNLKVVDASGSEPLAAAAAVSDAVEHVRRNLGACLLRMRIVRLSGHAFNDDQAYKSPELRAAEIERDPLPRLEEHLRSTGTSPGALEELRQSVVSEIREALMVVEGYPEPDRAHASTFLFSPNVSSGEARDAPPSKAWRAEISPRLNMLDAIRLTLDAELNRDLRVAVFGEDVARKGGVHSVTRNLYAKHGELRVFDTSLSEDGIIGRAAGMALAGLRPVPEIQFRKYLEPAYEQISDLGTLRWRTAGKFSAPVVVRIPVGYGKRCGDPWHGVNGEAILAHTLGWRIAFPSNAEDAVGLLRTALRGDDPTFFLEHRGLLDAPRARRPYPGDHFCLPFGAAATLLEGTDVTVVAWGDMVYRALEAVAAFPGRVTVLDLRTIVPWDQTTVLERVRRTGRVLVVHEDTHTAGFAAEIIATVTREAFEFLDAPMERLATLDCPTPYNVRLMDAVLPTVGKIRLTIQRLLDY